MRENDIMMQRVPTLKQQRVMDQEIGCRNIYFLNVRQTGHACGEPSVSL